MAGTPPPSPTKANPRQVTPRTFDGVEDFRQWMAHFELVMAANKWSENTAVLQLPLYLTGTAFQYFIDQKSQQNLDTWAKARDALKAVFAPQNSNQFDYARMINRKHVLGEPIQVYVLDKVEKINRWSPTADEKEKVGLVLTGLSAPFIDAVYEKKIDTLKELLEKLLMKEEAMKLVQHANAELDLNLMAQLQAARTSVPVQVPPAQANAWPQHQKPTCNKCKSDEHSYQHCPFVVCYNCNKRGHISRFCRAPRKPRNFRQGYQPNQPPGEPRA